MVVIVAVLSAATAIWSDRVPVNNGLGWDGQFYGGMASDPVGYVKRGELDDYQAQRILPSIVVHYVLRAGRIEPTTRNVIAAFEVLNAMLLTVASVMWVATAAAFKLRPSAAWLGWLGLFINFANLRQASYYAVLTDVSAFTLGLLMLYCFARKYAYALALLTFVGAFVWPVASAIGVLLLALPGGDFGNDGRGRGKVAVGAAVAAAAATLALTCYMYFVKRIIWQPAMTPAIPASIALATAYVGVCFASLLRGLEIRDLRTLLASVKWRNVTLALVPFLCARAIQHLLTGSVRGSYFRRMLRTLGTLAVAKPFNFYVPHVVYFGPILLLAALIWPSVAREVRRLGFGYTTVILLSIGLAMNSESRQALFGFPFLVAAIALAAQRRGWSGGANIAVGALALLASKIWMPMPIGSGSVTDQDLIRFPMQWYFMNHGPWISVPMYLIQSLAVAVLGIALLAVVRLQSIPRTGDDHEPAIPVEA